MTRSSMAREFSPASADFLNAALSPGMTRLTLIPEDSRRPNSTADSSILKPAFFKTPPYSFVFRIRSPRPLPVSCEMRKNRSRMLVPSVAGRWNCSSARAKPIAFGPAFSPSIRDASSTFLVRPSRTEPVAPLIVLMSASAPATSSAPCGTWVKTSVKEAVSPSNASPVAPVVEEIARNAFWIVSEAVMVAAAAAAMPRVTFFVSVLPRFLSLGPTFLIDCCAFIRAGVNLSSSLSLASIVPIFIIQS